MGQNLSKVNFRFVFYTGSGNLYGEESVIVGDVASGKIIRKKVSQPGRYWGIETWSKEKLFIYINWSLDEAQVFEDDEWKELKTDKTS